MAGALPIDPEEWDLVIDKLVRFHDNIQLEIVELVAKIKSEMNGTGSALVPIAEQKADYGKLIKKDIRRMWYLEYEIADLQEEFAKEMGSFDTENMTVDFIEDMLIKSKPLQIVLLGIRKKQKDTMDELKKTYGEQIKDLEALYIPRPPKPDHDTLLLMKEGMSMSEAAKNKEPVPAEAIPEGDAAATPAPEGGDLPAEPGPAIVGNGDQAPVEAAA